MNNKITVIEGPTPEFEKLEEVNIPGTVHAWLNGILEGPYLYDLAHTTVRTFDGQKLLDRCHNAWNQKQPMFLEYKDMAGLKVEAQIVAARADEVDQGDVLHLWVRWSEEEEPDFPDEDTSLDADWGDEDIPF